MVYQDAGHRPHATHYDEQPITPIDLGPDGLRVTLDTWGPQQFVNEMAAYLQSNWGDDPMYIDDLATLETSQWVDACFQGQTLQQVLEGLSFWFTIDGVSRATTHQIVRTRIGAGFMQHGGRDNDWRHRRFRLPETVRRLIIRLDRWMGKTKYELPYHMQAVDDYLVPVNRDDVQSVIRYLDACHTKSLGSAVREYLQHGKQLYAALVDAGVPWQDARRFLPIGTETYIHAQYTYPALKGFLLKRLEHVMDWEINCVAQLMLRQIHMKCPPIISAYLGSASDVAQRAMFAGMESWPPDGKWPVPEHFSNIPRMHTPEQMPFWVLHPSSMQGGPVRWIPTNGTYPDLAKYRELGVPLSDDPTGGGKV